MAEWHTTPRQVSGDARVAEDDGPVGLGVPEDVFVHGDAVAGDLYVRDGEYVFTDVPTDGDGTASTDDTTASTDGDRGASSDGTGPAVETAIEGGEDGYVEAAGGDVVVDGVEDVFVHHRGADRVDASGAEQVFTDETAQPTKPPAEYEVTVSGWQHDREARDPRDGVGVVGARNEIVVRELEHDATVYVVGWGNEIRVEGRDAEVSVFFVGRDNTVTVGPFLSAAVAAESGFDNTLDHEPVPPSAVVQTTREEAHEQATFGRHKLTWQEPADGEEWCPNCGSNADAVIRRRQRDAFYVLGRPILTYDEGGESFECEHCSRYDAPVSLSEAERREALR
jgi:hypothetical protein